MRRLATLLVLFGLAASGCGRPDTSSTSAPAPAPPTPPAQPAAEPAAAAPGGPPQSVADWARGATVFSHLGTFHREITTDSAEAQQFFDQGLALTYGLQSRRGRALVRQGGPLDPSCAMCWWGAAYAMGPNYNMPMLPERAAAVAWDALQRAQQAAAKASPVEQALVAPSPTATRGPTTSSPQLMQAFSQAYANAMKDVADEFPDDPDVQVLFAEVDDGPKPVEAVDAGGRPGARAPRPSSPRSRACSRRSPTTRAPTTTTSTPSRPHTSPSAVRRPPIDAVR